MMGLPRVGVVYTRASALSRENEQMAKYLALCLATSGRCEKTTLAALTLPSGSDSDITGKYEEGPTVAIRCDGTVLDSTKLPTETYEETSEWQALSQCHLWLLLVDADVTLKTAELLHKKAGKATDEKRPRRVVLSLQTTMRRLAQLSQALPDAIVLHGGTGFQVIKDANGALRPLSHGCFFVERLAKEKTVALYALDVLEGTGIQVLSRRNIQALKWGSTMLRAFYYINALTGRSVLEGLRDRNTRFVFLQALFEMDALFEKVLENVMAAANSNDSGRGGSRSISEPDSSASTLFSVRSIMVLLPLPNWLFNGLVLRLLDLGLGPSSSNDRSVVTCDLEQTPPLETSFDSEFRDVFELAKGRDMELPALELLQSTLASLQKQRLQQEKDKVASETPTRISSTALLAQLTPSTQITARSRTFFLKALSTVVATLLLGLYLFVL